ncbi:MAG: sugar transporter subunit [Firmicutes bacterium]|nr:sugar transporter subunit [Bacillota bacterium]
MVVEGLLVGLVVFFVKFCEWWGNWPFSRPLVVAALVGILLGHPTEGIIMGASLELVFLGVISIGGSVPSEPPVGAALGTAYAILLHQGAEVSIALAVPIGMLAVLYYQALKLVITAMVPLFDKFLDKRQDGFYSAGIIAIAIIQPVLYGLLAFLGIVLGTDAIQAVLKAVPPYVMQGLMVSAGIIPALGFAMLLKVLWNREIVPFFFLGFVLAAYLKLPIIAIAIIGTCIAMYICMNEHNSGTKIKANQGTAVTNSASGKEDFFNV